MIAAGSQISVLTVVRVNALRIISTNCYTLSSYSNCCHQVLFALPGGRCLFFRFILSLCSLCLLFSFSSHNCYLHLPLSTFPADPFTGTRVPLGVPPISSGWTVKKGLRLLDSIRPSADNALASKFEEWRWHFSPGFWATARGRRVLENVCFIIRHLRNTMCFLKGPGLNG